MIEVSHVSKRYGPVRALADVSFSIPKGQIVGLLGPNGAGKTTLIRITTGFIPPSAGRVGVCGHDVVADSARARGSIGYLPEAAPIYPEMAVLDYLGFRARLFGVARRARRVAIDRAVERCRLTEVRGRRVGHLSKGYRQRVGLAAAMLHDPPVLVLDEPTNGLDPTQIAQARSLIRELAEDRTVLVSSHILPEIEMTCDRVVVIAGGGLRADGTPRELVERFARGGGAPYVVEASGAGGGARLTAALGGVDGVAGVRAETLGGPGAGEPAAAAGRRGRAVVTPDAGAGDLREALGRAVTDAGMAVCELRRVTPTLEQVFFRVIEGEPGTGDTGAAVKGAAVTSAGPSAGEES